MYAEVVEREVVLVVLVSSSQEQMCEGWRPWDVRLLKDRPSSMKEGGVRALIFVDCCVVRDVGKELLGIVFVDQG